MFTAQISFNHVIINTINTNTTFLRFKILTTYNSRHLHMIGARYHTRTIWSMLSFMILHSRHQKPKSRCNHKQEKSSGLYALPFYHCYLTAYQYLLTARLHIYIIFPIQQSSALKVLRFQPVTVTIEFGIPCNRPCICADSRSLAGSLHLNKVW